MKRILNTNSALVAAIAFACMASPASAIEAPRVSTDPGIVKVAHKKTLKKKKSARRHHRRHRGRVVDAPFAYVESGRRTIVDAPFTHVYVDRRGRRHVVAPFVDLWTP